MMKTTATMTIMVMMVMMMKKKEEEEKEVGGVWINDGFVSLALAG